MLYRIKGALPFKLHFLRPATRLNHKNLFYQYLAHVGEYFGTMN